MPPRRDLTPAQFTALRLIIEGKIARGTLVHRGKRLGLYLAFDYAGTDYSNQVYSLRKRKSIAWVAEQTVAATPEGREEYERLSLGHRSYGNL